MVKIAVVGGGASGLMAAVTAGNFGDTEVTVFEQKSRVGKKILATGNGRCNLTNTNASPEHYYGRNKEFIRSVLTLCAPPKTLALFSEIGLLCKEEHGGRVFPYSQQASTVVDVFRNRLAGLAINVENGVKIKDVIPEANGFRLEGVRHFEGVKPAEENGYFEKKTHAEEKNYQEDEDKVYFCDRLILACGGMAGPVFGSDGSGFSLLEKLGHSIIKPVPALVQLKTDTDFCKGLTGIKVECGIKAFVRGEERVRDEDPDRVKVTGQTKEVDRAAGEVLFTAYGLSGSGILDISRVLYQNEKITLSLDFMPDHTPEKVEEMLFERQKTLSGLTLEQYLVGLINKKVGYALLKRSGIERLSRGIYGLKPVEIRAIARTVKNLEIAVTGHNGWANAQVTAGGADTGEFDYQTMASRKIPGLYCAGEIFDVFGDCGGYNLQWAWSSGYLAGLSAAGGKGC